MSHRVTMFTQTSTNNASSYAISGKQQLVGVSFNGTFTSTSGVLIQGFAQLSKNPAYSTVDGDVNIVAAGAVSVGLVAATVVNGSMNVYINLMDYPLALVDGEKLFLNTSITAASFSLFATLHFV